MSQLFVSEDTPQEIRHGRLSPRRHPEALDRRCGPPFETDVSRIGQGPLGSKVEALLSLSHLVERQNQALSGSDIRISIPHMHVIATDYFDRFMTLNGLHDIDVAELEDRDIARLFLEGFLPAELVSQLYALLETLTAPLAVRTSRLMPLPVSRGSNSTSHCKLIPNNRPTLEERVGVLKAAVKLMYATSLYRDRREHLECLGMDFREDKTAILLQEVVGERHGDRFYPVMSGTSSSGDFYRCPGNRRLDGSAWLLFGLGKGNDPGVLKPWCCSHSAPSASLPFDNARRRLSSTQTRFFAIDMTAKGGDPTDVFEYITTETIKDAERHPAFPLLVSTYDAQNDRFVPGTGNPGPRVLDFAPLLVLKSYPFDEALGGLRRGIEETLHQKVVIELAASMSPVGELQIHLLQVTPLFSQTSRIRVTDDLLRDEGTIVASENALGNGVAFNMTDFVYLDPETFTTNEGVAAAQEVEAINRKLMQQHRRYILVGMGRIGTSDPFRGLPVAWHQISGARVFIETDLPDAMTDFSRGNHFHGDLVSCGGFYLYTPKSGALRLSFDKLDRMPLIEKGRFVRHVRSPMPLQVLVDGRTRRGVVRQNPSAL